MAPIALRVTGCEGVAERLSELLDGELGVADAVAVRLHLATCAGCARLAVELEATVRALHRLPAPRRGAPRLPS